MSWVTDDQIALIDQRIAAARLKDRAIGTVQSRDTTGSGATVVVDGSTQAIPVKVVGNVFAQPGDRVLLDRYGTEWIVTGSFSTRSLGEASSSATGPGSTVNVTSTSFVDISDLPSVVFTKFFDNTFVRVQFLGMQFIDVAVTKVRYALRFTQLTGSTAFTATDFDMNYYAMASGIENVHLPSTYMTRLTTLPAGQYTVQARWRRISGTGLVKWNVDDQMGFEIDERVKSASPFL